MKGFSFDLKCHYHAWICLLLLRSFNCAALCSRRHALPSVLLISTVPLWHPISLSICAPSCGNVAISFYLVLLPASVSSFYTCELNDKGTHGFSINFISIRTLTLKLRSFLFFVFHSPHCIPLSQLSAASGKWDSGFRDANWALRARRF